MYKSRKSRSDHAIIAQKIKIRNGKVEKLPKNIKSRKERQDEILPKGVKV